ncbi:MAG: TrbC/VirB2 family protein [bacterium]
MESIKKVNGLISRLDEKFQASSKTRTAVLFALLALFVFAFIGRDVSAATVSVTGGALGDFYNTIIGFIYGPIGIIIAVFIFLFGVIMMISKHFFIMIMAIVAIILFFLAPDLVLGFANMGAALSGAII